MKLAYAAHHGQADKGGVPYIFHPMHLAEQMEDEISCAAALLHDVVEDTPITIEELEEQFPPEVTEVLRLLTHPKGEPYMDYVRRLAPHPVARKIKLADLAHNDNEERTAACGCISPETRQRLKQKYAEAKAYLLTFEE